MKFSLKIRAVFFATMASVFIAGSVAELRAQTYLETFGQNRIQTRKYDWRFFDTEHFRIYHYDLAGRQLARYVAEQAEKDIKIIEKKMGGKFPHRFNIILYNNYDEYRQTNVGKKYDSQIQDIPAGTVNLVGDRLVVYYTGVHTDLRRQLRSGMSRVVMERMLFGESFREMIKNAVLLNLPTWTTNGFIAYLVDGWDTESETKWKNLLQANPTQGFYDLAERDPELAGKAFWKFISERYGENNVKNLLYTMQLKSSLPQGIKMTLNQTVKQTYDSVIKFYNEIYTKDALVQEHSDSFNKAILEIPVPKNNTQIRSVKVSPRGFDVAYVTWKDGEFEVYIQHTNGDQERSAIISGGEKDYNETPDPDYPLLAWSNNGFKLAILYRKGRQTRLRIYNSVKAKMEDYIVPNNRFERVQGMTFMEDDDKLVFSAVKKSQTDLYEFRIKGSRITPITNDPWDDLQPWFVSGGARRGILFLSNRPQPNLKVPIQVNELPTSPMNVFFYDTKTRRTELLQASSITKGTISQPIQYGSDHFAFLYDQNGITNKYVVLFGRNQKNEDSAYAVPITNYSQSIISHQYNPASNQVADVIQVGDKFKVYFKPLEIPGINATEKNLQPSLLSIKNEINTPPVVEPNTIIPLPERADKAVLQGGNIFQSEFEEEAVAAATDTASIAPVPAAPTDDTITLALLGETDSILVDSTYIKLKAQPYRLSFKPDFFTVRLDNSILFNKYQPADIMGGAPPSQPLGGMISVSLNDALEDHRFTGGLRLPVNFSGLTYFLQYENFKRRVDWGILYVRTENHYQYNVRYIDTVSGAVFDNPQLGKVTSSLLQGSASYPLDRRTSIRLHFAFRQDVLNFKAQDTLSLSYLTKEKTYWTMSRAEYVFDNTTTPALNIRNGIRYKIYGEYFYKLSAPNGGFYNLGFDVRYYKKIYKHIISATRIAYAHSGGNQKINYIMGGVDNWIAPKQNPMPPPPTENFAFQTLATNLRGYEQNARRGNTFGVINAEIRAPILTSIMKRPIQSAFLKNLQAVAFMDVGSAWNGVLPSEQNLNQPYIFYTPPMPVYVSIAPPDNAVAIGYGGGLRTMLFGYFMRFDAAWNIEGRRKPILYFSIGTDF